MKRRLDSIEVRDSELMHYGATEAQVRQVYFGQEGAQLDLLGGLMDVQAEAVVAPKEAYHRKRGKMDDYFAWWEEMDGRPRGRDSAGGRGVLIYTIGSSRNGEVSTPIAAPRPGAVSTQSSRKPPGGRCLQRTSPELLATSRPLNGV